MKKSSTIFVFCFVLFYSLNAGAQNKGSYLSVYGGMTAPLVPDDFYNYFSPSINFGANYEYKFENFASAGADINYASYPFDKNNFTKINGFSVAGGNMNVIAINAFVKVEFNEKAIAPVAPFLKFGLGFHNTSLNDIKFTSGNVIYSIITESTSDLLTALNCGLSFQLENKNKLFLEASYRSHYNDKKALGSWLFNGGYTFYFGN